MRKIPIYLPQLFYNLLKNLKEIDIIPSQYELVNPLISKEFMTIKDEKATLGPIFDSVHVKHNNINIYQEYHWIFSEEELDKLRKGRPDEQIYYQGLMQYKSSIKFTVTVCRKAGGSNRTAFAIEIKECAAGSVSGHYSVMIDELGYVFNNYPFNNISKGGYSSTRFFSDSLVDSLDNLSLHLSIHFK